MFEIVRLIFCIIALVVCFFLIKKSRVLRKRRWYIICIIIAVMLTILSVLIPIENIFVTFSSPESAYGYVNKGEVKLVVNGKKSDFVIGENGDTDIYAIIPKSDDGWKLGMGADTKRIIKKISDGIIIYVYQYRNSDDYYITVLDTNGGESKITDNQNSEFYHLDKINNTLNKTFYTYFAYVENLNNQYIITVNGNSISVAISIKNTPNGLNCVMKIFLMFKTNMKK